MKQFVTPTGILEVPEIAEAKYYPSVQKTFKPKMHPNDRVRIAISKKNLEKPKIGATIHSFSLLKHLMN